MSDRITWTINASGDYKNRKMLAGQRSARFATEFMSILSNPASFWGRSPLTLSISAEGKWQKTKKPTLTGQIKLSVPIATGIELPVVYRFANRTALLDAGDAQARVGLSIDTGRLTHIFQ